MRIYLDSCVVIYLIEGAEELSRSIRSILAPTEAPPSGCFSELTRLECRVGPVRKGDAGLLAQFDAFFANRGVEMIPWDREIFELATRIRALHGTKTPMPCTWRQRSSDSVRSSGRTTTGSTQPPGGGSRSGLLAEATYPFPDAKNTSTESSSLIEWKWWGTPART